MLRKWDDLPSNMKNASVKEYYDILCKKRFSLFLKRIFDIIFAILIFIVLSPIFVVLSIVIKIDSKGPIMFSQLRITQYGRPFKIYKFRTMVVNAEKLGSQVTTKNDVRVTRVGKFLRRYRLDEFPQLFNIITGDMSFVGTRPEVSKYVERYTENMIATLLLPAGVTSQASIMYKDENELISIANNIDSIYVRKILPIKMEYNLKNIKNFSCLNDFKIIVMTIIAIFDRK